MDIRKIKKLIELLEESGIAEIEIKEGEEAVRISRMPASTSVMQPAQMTHLSPETLEMAGRIFSAIVADVASGKSHQHIVSSVRRAMRVMPHDVAAD